MKATRFMNAAAVKQTFGTVDFPGKNLAVFDIGGNKYRLITYIRYSTSTNVGRVWIRHVLTHVEYDRWSDDFRKRKSKKGKN